MFRLLHKMQIQATFAESNFGLTVDINQCLFPKDKATPLFNYNVISICALRTVFNVFPGLQVDNGQCRAPSLVGRAPSCGGGYMPPTFLYQYPF